MVEGSKSSLRTQFLLPRNLTQYPERRQLIDQIVKNDSEVFHEWVADSENAQRLDMPHEALRYVLIPPRILEIVEDPTKVDVINFYNTDDCIKAAVFVPTSHLVTNKDHLEDYLYLLSKHHSKTSADISLEPERPSDVDKFHAYYSWEGYDEKFELTDFITNEICLSAIFDQILNVDSYDDQEELRYQGVARSWYTRLHDATKKMGFRFITGYNNPQNIKMFTQKLGRIPLDQIQIDQRWLLHPHHKAGEFPNLFTTDFLYEEDKEKFVIADSQVINQE